jgi:ATP-dependent Lhr-like helicase
VSTFSRFPPRLQEAIVSRLGWSSLRPVQELAGAAILDGKNTVVLAPTAGGKTEAAIFPVLATLMTDEPRGIGALYIAPIKALLNNQEERLGTYTEMVGLRSFVWHGDTSPAKKAQFVRDPANLLITTPESIEVMLLSSRVPINRLFPDLRCVIVDEVHAFAGTDRGAHLMSVVERVARLTENDVQRIGLSATVGNPAEILRWIQGSSKRAGEVIDPPKVPARRQLEVVLAETTQEIAENAGRDALGKKSLFFCQSRSMAESVAERMRGNEIEVHVHHGSVALESRREAEKSFHAAMEGGGGACIVCTSTLELGIDVGDFDLVFQANAPSTVSSFLQRMGRTGRREGRSAHTKFLCEDPEAVLPSIALIELARSGWIESVPSRTRCWPVMVHQLLVMTLQFGAISADDCWEQLRRVPDFAGIERAEFDKLVAYMLKEDYLYESGGLLSMGDAAEQRFGRRNFQKLYSVFSTPQLYQVKTETDRDIGSLEQNFVDLSLPPEPDPGCRSF